MVNGTMRTAIPPIRSKQTLDPGLAIGISLLVALLIVSGLVSFWNVRRLYSDSNWVDHTHRVLNSLDAIVETIRNAESAQRGYIITGNADYLEIYHGAAERSDDLIKEFKRLTIDNPRQQRRIPELKMVTAERLKTLEENKALYDSQGFEAAQKSIQTNRGRQQMLALRTLIDEMEKDETDLLDRRSEQTEATFYTTIIADAISTVLGLLAIAAFARLLRRHWQAKAEAAAILWEEREQFQTTLASIGDAVMTTDTSRRVVFMNAVAASMTGWTAEEARGESLSTVLNIINEQTREPAVNPVDKVLREGVIVGLANHTVLIQKGGGEIPIDDSAAPIFDRNGKVTGCVFVFRDITERKEAEAEIERLLAKERRRAGQLRKLTDAALTLNSATTRESVVGVVKAEAKLVFEAEDAEVLWQEAAPASDGTIAAPLIARSGQPFGYLHLNLKENNGFTPDDKSILVQLAHMAAVAVQNAQLYEELRTANDRKNEFLATLAHELRNPLAPIRNSLQLMQIAPNDSQVLEQSRAMIERQVTQMVRLIDELLDISRISRGKVELRQQNIDLQSVVAAAIEASRPLIDARQHQLTIDIPTKPIVMYADSTRLAQVVMNLLNNAAKYTEPGGQIWLTVEDLPQSVAIKVRDNGIGIPAEMFHQVFEMFSQVDRSLERSEGGLGIGLTLVRRLVELHGGQVAVISEGEGKGSEFVVTLPKSESCELSSTNADGQISQTARPPKGTQKIVAVDDNRDAVDSLAMMLRMKGHEVRTAYDGLEAVDAVASFKPQIVLLDIGLPRLNGYDAARQIRQLPGGDQLVLVAVTGWGQAEDRKRSQEAGFDLHLVKPVDPLALDQLLANVAESRVQVS
jgi:PAS domain S-box-containing protein